MQGAYSVIPGSYNALRALARGAELLGAEEARRSAQDSRLIDAATIQMKHPAATYRAAREAFSVLNANPLFMYYLLGRLAMGGGRCHRSRLAGDALRAVENGHDVIDSLFKYGGGGGGAPPPGP